MNRLKRKIDKYLIDWKNSSNKMPLIIKSITKYASRLNKKQNTKLL